MTEEQKTHLYGEAKAIQFWLVDIDRAGQLRGEASELLRQSINQLHILSDKIRSVETEENQLNGTGN